MSIDTTALTSTMPLRVPPRQLRSGRDAALPFANLLATAAKAAEGGAQQQEAVQELMRIEMLQSSLAIGGDGAPRNYQSPALAALLNGLSTYQDAARAQGAAEAMQQSAAPAPQPGAEGSVAATGEITRTAAHFLGTPYRFGGEGASGIDCSSFVQQVFREHQIDLPRTAREQITVGRDVARADLKEGDLVFFHTYASYPSHVGIYLGNGKMIHASSRAGEVTVSDMNTDYFQARYLGAKRVS